MIHGFDVAVHGGRVYLTDGAKPVAKNLLKITAQGIVPLVDDYETRLRAHKFALHIAIQNAVARYVPGTTFAVRGSRSDRPAFRDAGFRVISNNLSARAGRFILGL
jgi:hypothetical protein